MTYAQHLHETGRAEGRKEGRAEGRADARAELQQLLVDTLQQRFGSLPPAVVAHCEGADLAALGLLLTRAAVIDAPEELLPAAGA